ncbi:MAG: chitobiase/beta-hexosaminidase C-terminal domain-containing protein [Lachnospiraceae bacterium]
MKCANCGAELKIGCIYCSKCGQEAQIVPDYNIIEDDISSFLNEENKVKEKSDKKMPVMNNKNNDKKKKTIIIAGSSAIAFLTVIISLLLLSSYQKNHSFDYQYNRGLDYMKVGLFDKSYDCLERALKLQPKNENGNIAMADWEFRQQRSTDAVNRLLDVIQENPNSYRAYELLLKIYEDNGDYHSITEISEGVTNKKILQLFENYIIQAPKFDKAEGDYDNYITVSLSVEDDAQIFYTLDGTDPTKNGRLYTTELKLEEGTTTIRAIAMNDFSIYSAEVTGVYKIQLKVPEAPEASLNSGTYETPEEISFLVTEGCTIYYTWDGSTPTAQSTKYMGSFDLIEGNNVLSAIAINENNMSSEVARFNYIYHLPEEESTEDN